MPLGKPGVLRNNQCTLDVGTSTVTRTGNDLVLNLPVAFDPRFNGTKAIYMLAKDYAGLSTYWQRRGT
ncbi:MAG: hypothetical protein ACE14L_00570 [Terriglobales bacterium]